MKKLIFAAVTWLFAASQLLSQKNTLQIFATGTGETTGKIATLTVFNPGTEPQTVSLPPCLIPSGGQYQDYIVPNLTTATVAPGATVNIPVIGFCTDVFTPPVPSGQPMPPVSGWLTAAQSPTAASLLDVLEGISTAFDKLKNEGAIHTPFSGDPEKEQKAVTQQTFWIHAAELSGKTYEKEDFRAITIKQFEKTTGQKFTAAPPETRQNVEQGVNDFWNTFEAVGEKAKLLATASTSPTTSPSTALFSEPTTGGNPPELIGVNDDRCECGDISLKAEVVVTKGGKKGDAETFSLTGGSNVRDTTKAKVSPADKGKAIPADEIKLTITDLVTKCTECNAGPCILKPDSRELTVTTVGLTESLDDKKLPKEQKLEGVDIFQPKKGVVAEGTDPVRYYIKVKYTCEKPKCVPKPCEKTFEITLERDPAKKK